MLIPQLQKESYLTKIDIPWALPCLEERFDDALTMIGKGCLIYGGAIRDVIADLPIGGDLDVAVPHNQFNRVLRRFDTSSRWITQVKKGAPMFRNSKAYSEGKLKSLISNMITYIDLSGAEVQLVQAAPSRVKDTEHDEGIMNLIRNVDILCSGVTMNVCGDTTEVVSGAVEDCENRELNINKDLDSKLVDAVMLRSRVRKLVKRGWKNNINLDEFKER
jgi:hypothetical protein